MSRKQHIENLLNGITSTELNTYLKEHNLINKDKLKSLELLKRNKSDSHFNVLLQQAGDKLNEGIDVYYKLGQATVIGILLNEFYDEKFTIADVKSFFKTLMNDNEKLKEYVYEYMKDLK